MKKKKEIMTYPNNRKVVARALFKHFKGGIYRVITIATHTETGEKMVIYKDEYDRSNVYARPMSMFLEEVDKEKYPDCLQKYRFGQCIV
jgi:hypothetical protein